MSVVDDRDQVDYTPGPLDRDATFYVAGHRGLVGSAIWRHLELQGFQALVGKSSAELDLKDRQAVFAYMGEMKPRYVVLAAAKVGGILANSTYPVDFLSENLRIQTNVLDAAVTTVSIGCCFSARHASTRDSLPNRSSRTHCSRVTSSRRTTPTPSRRSPGSCTSKPCVVSTACRGSQRCRPTSTVRTTTSRRPVLTSCRL